MPVASYRKYKLLHKESSTLRGPSNICVVLRLFVSDIVVVFIA